MKFLFLIAFMLTCTGAFCQSALSTASSEDKSFSVQYPSAWKAKVEQYKKTAIVSLTAPTEGIVRIDVQRGELPSEIKTLDQVITQQVPEIKKQFGINSLDQNLRMGNRHKLSYAFKTNDKNIAINSYYWLDNGFMIIATYSAELKDFSNFLYESEKIIKAVGPYKAGTATTTTTTTTNNSTQMTTEPKKETGLTEVDCSAISGFNLITKAPAGISPVEKYGSVRLSDNKKFQVGISSVGNSIEKEKKSLAANTMNVLQKYVVDEPNGIIYESEAMGQKQFHFKYILNTDNGPYYFEDTKGVQYDLASVQLMYKAAKESRLKAVKTSSNNDGSNATTKENKSTDIVTTIVNKVDKLLSPKENKKTDKKDNDVTDQSSSNENLENGPYELKDDAGNVLVKGQYKNGKRTGKWQYFEKGQLSRELDYKDDKLDGKKTIYYSNGKKEFEETYVNGKRNGEYTGYSMTSGNITQVKHYVDNKLDGEFKTYSEKGTVTEEGNYKDEKKDGVWKRYDPKGKLIKTQNYVDGKWQE